MKKRKACGTISKFKKLGENLYDFHLNCQHCHETNEVHDFDSKKGNIIVCKNCYQRIVVNRTDIRFHDFAAIMYRFYYRFILSFILLNPSTYRIFSPVIAWGGSLRRKLKIPFRKFT